MMLRVIAMNVTTVSNLEPSSSRAMRLSVCGVHLSDGSLSQNVSP